MNKVLVFGLLLTAGCKSIQPMNTSNPLPAFDTEAHRGGRGLMPENSILAMLKAADLRVTTLELDCHVSKDHQVIAAHDDHINPLYTLDPQGKAITEEEAKKLIFYQMDYAEIKKYDTGSKYYAAFPNQQKQKTHIPRLADLIDSVQLHLKKTGKKQVFYNIETKSSDKGDGLLQPEPETFVKLLMDVIEQKRIKPWVIIQSFDPRTLEILHKKHPDVKTSFLTSAGSLAENLRKLSFKPAVYSPNFKLVNAALVQECRGKGMKIIPWTVNTTEEIARLTGLGVDGIITDYPNLFDER